MATRKLSEEDLLAKIRSLPPERAAEVEDFVDFLCRRGEERRLARSAARLSEPAFTQVWGKPDDAGSDRP